MNDLLARLKGRTAALVAAGITATAVFILVGILVRGLLAFAEGDTESGLQALARYHAEALARPQALVDLKQVLAQAAVAPGLLQATSTSLAEASLESDVKAIAKDNGADVRSANILPAEWVKDFEVVSIAYDLTVPMSRLKDLTYGIESRTPYLFIDHAMISGSQGWEPQGNAAKDLPLDVRWTVRAYRWAGKR